MSSDSEGFESADEDIDDIVHHGTPKNIDERKQFPDTRDLKLKTDVTASQGESSSYKTSTPPVKLESKTKECDKLNKDGNGSSIHCPKKGDYSSEMLSKVGTDTVKPAESSAGEKADELGEDKGPRINISKEKNDGSSNDWSGGWGDDSKLEGWDIEEEDGFSIPQTLGSNIKTIDVESVVENVNQSSEPQINEENVSSEPKEISNKPTSVWGGWGGWGVSSLLSTATEGVQSLTQQVSSVSSGITSAIGGGIEGLLEAPDPEELAKMTLKDQEEAEAATGQEEPSPTSVVPDLFGLSNLIGGVSQLGSKVISGGLDTLENLGKKTMEVLQEGDPGLKKKRAFLFQSDKPILSQVLREAKERNESEEKVNEDDASLRKVQYETLFDDFHGLVHLEALEMISRQCEIKVQLLLTEAGEDEETLADYKETLQSVKELCELPQEEDEETIGVDELKSRLETAMEALSVSVLLDKLLTITFNSDSCENKHGTEIHQDAIITIAKFTAIAMEFLHRIAESLLISELSSPASASEALISITIAAKSRVCALADDYCAYLTKLNASANSALVTNVYLEASNSNNYLENAFGLLVPVLQLGALS